MKFRSARRGVSLVELMVTLSACSVLLSMCAMLMHRMFHSHRRGTVATAQEQTLWRLETAFRRDVLLARAVQGAQDDLPAEVFVRLDMGNSVTIDYRLAETQIKRMVQRPATPSSREQFQFAQPVSAQVARSSASVVQLQLKSIPPAEDVNPAYLPPPVLLEVTAQQTGDAIPPGWRVQQQEETK
jgi:type II secretory pathway component PulJ